MEIPYTVKPRPDTGLANPKLGIWLFLASEVMLFGGLFAGYIFMRLSAEPWMWPHGWLNVPVGTFNTFILIFSSVTIILSWESLKMHQYKAFKMWLAATWICGLAFLGVKLGYEWPDKFGHFGAYIKQESLHKYEAFLGNEDVKDASGKAEAGRTTRGLPERRFISGHLHESEGAMKLATVPYITKEHLDGMIGGVWSLQDSILADEELVKKDPEPIKPGLSLPEKYAAEHVRVALKEKLAIEREGAASRIKLLENYGMNEADIATLLKRPAIPTKPTPAELEEQKKAREAFLEKVNHIRIHLVDPENANPYDPDNDNAHFVPRSKVAVETIKDRPNVEEETENGKKEYFLVLNKADLLEHHGAFTPKLNTYLATYFMITGLHGLHVLGGCIVFFYFWLPIKGGSKLYKTNHAQLCNRIEVAGLFWHLVDLIWIFVFPLFYLL